MLTWASHYFSHQVRMYINFFNKKRKFFMSQIVQDKFLSLYHLYDLNHHKLSFVKFCHHIRERNKLQLFKFGHLAPLSFILSKKYEINAVREFLSQLPQQVAAVAV